MINIVFGSYLAPEIMHEVCTIAGEHGPDKWHWIDRLPEFYCDSRRMSCILKVTIVHLPVIVIIDSPCMYIHMSGAM